MKHIQLQTDILKAKAREEKGARPNTRFEYGKVDNNLYIVVNTHYIVIVPENVWYLDNSKVFAGPPLTSIESLIEHDFHETQYELVDTGVTITLDNGIKAKRLSSGDFSTYLDESNLKYFGKDVTRYTAHNERSLIHLYNYDTLIGVVCPIKNVS